MVSDDNYFEQIRSEFEPEMVRLFKELMSCRDAVLAS